MASTALKVVAVFTTVPSAMNPSFAPPWMGTASGVAPVLCAVAVLAMWDPVAGAAWLIAAACLLLAASQQQPTQPQPVHIPPVSSPTQPTPQQENNPIMAPPPPQQQHPALGTGPDALQLSDREASFVTPRDQTNVVSEEDASKAYMPLGSGYNAQGVGGRSGEPLAY